jgi:4-hydroxy-tetrahydrodipicolinate synthase
MPVRGIVTAMVTPLAEDGSVAEDAFVKLLHHLADNGSDGVVVAGTTGESPTLSDEEKVNLFRLAVDNAPERLTVVAGTGSNDTAHSVHLTERAAQVGVHAVLVVAPYYNKPNRRGLLAHYRAVAAATDREVVLYNIPSRSVIDMPNDLLAELGQIENVTAVKQARAEQAVPVEGLDLLAGNDDMLADVLDRGGAGGILVASHLVGPEMRAMIDQPERRREIHESLMPLFEALAVTTGPIPVKAAMAMLGHDVGGLRLPLVEASEAERDVVRAALEAHGLLSRV